jgi:hypothetical protein
MVVVGIVSIRSLSVPFWVLRFWLNHGLDSNATSEAISK